MITIYNLSVKINLVPKRNKQTGTTKKKDLKGRKMLTNKSLDAIMMTSLKGDEENGL